MENETESKIADMLPRSTLLSRIYHEKTSFKDDKKLDKIFLRKKCLVNPVNAIMVRDFELAKNWFFVGKRIFIFLNCNCILIFQIFRVSNRYRKS